MADPSALADRIEKAVFICSEAGKGWAPFSDEERVCIVRALRDNAKLRKLVEFLKTMEL